MTAEWIGPHWSVSPHNYDPEIRVSARPVALHDITLRDGEECADVSLGVEDKVMIAEALCEVGIRRIEFFLTVPGWQELLRQLASRRLPADLYVTWRPGRVEKALEMGARHVMVWFRASDQYQQHVLKRERKALLDETLQAIRHAKAAGAHVNLFLPEATRTTLEQLREVLQASAREGADAATLVDSLSIARPAAIAFLVRKMREWVSLPIEVHCHNDFGLATASVLAAYEAGAEAIHTAVNGLGYRAGNSALDEVAVSLQALYGVETGIALERLPWLSALVERITGRMNGYFKPVVGAGAFRYEQWGATAALEAAGLRSGAFPFEPELVGRKASYIIGKWSDLAAVERRLAELGMTATAEQAQAIFRRATTAALARRRPLTDGEFLEAAAAEGAAFGG
jgi:isopropylmalate/homocitrate/citramalate synthase